MLDMCRVPETAPLNVKEVVEGALAPAEAMGRPRPMVAAPAPANSTIEGSALRLIDPSMWPPLVRALPVRALQTIEGPECRGIPAFGGCRGGEAAANPAGAASPVPGSLPGTTEPQSKRGADHGRHS